MGGSGSTAEGGMTKYAWDSPQILGLFGASIVLILLFLWIERIVKEPIIPLKLFSVRAIFGIERGGFHDGDGHVRRDRVHSIVLARTRLTCGSSRRAAAALRRHSS